MSDRDQGFQLVELLVTLAILSVALTLTVPSLERLTTRLRVEMGAREVMTALRQARFLALRHSARVAVKFRVEPGGRVSYTLHRDGDGDGVLNADIDSGVDPQVLPPRILHHFGRRVRFGFPPGSAPRDPGDSRRRLERLDDPIRFNRSDLASFSPLGGSTPGSLYLTDGRDELVAVRVYGRTGKVKLLRYDRERERWR